MKSGAWVVITVLSCSIGLAQTAPSGSRPTTKPANPFAAQSDGLMDLIRREAVQLPPDHPTSLQTSQFRESQSKAFTDACVSLVGLQRDVAFRIEDIRAANGANESKLHGKFLVTAELLHAAPTPPTESEKKFLVNWNENYRTHLAKLNSSKPRAAEGKDYLAQQQRELLAKKGEGQEKFRIAAETRMPLAIMQLSEDDPNVAGWQRGSEITADVDVVSCTAEVRFVRPDLRIHVGFEEEMNGVPSSRSLADYVESRKIEPGESVAVKLTLSGKISTTTQIKAPSIPSK